ncbi:MAG: hypothetical protein PUD73_08705 [bacterium]|nr:hypothetical protein [bacterium]
MKQILSSIEIKYVVLSSVIFAFVFGLTMLLWNAGSTIILLVDAITFGAIVLLVWGGFVFANNYLGTFDMLKYSFKLLTSKNAGTSNKSFKEGYKAYIRLQERKLRLEPLLLGGFAMCVAVVLGFIIA